jgi:phage gp36-like protein
MTYATKADLIARFSERELVQLTDRGDEPTGAVDDARVDRALAEADNLVNSYVGARYPLPFLAIPELLVDLACDIARYRLYQEGATDEVRERYEDAIKRLTAISRGDMVLDAAGVEPASRDDQVYADTGERMFSRDRMRGG